MRYAHQHGFSLLELMTAVVIIGILAAIALPSYSNYVLRSNRTVGKTILMQIAGQQENFFVDRKRYAAALGPGSAANSLNYPAAQMFVLPDGRTTATSSSDAIYRVEISAATETTFTAQATPLNRQTKDTDCSVLSVTNTGTRSATGTKASECWSR